MDLKMVSPTKKISLVFLLLLCLIWHNGASVTKDFDHYHGASGNVSSFGVEDHAEEMKAAQKCDLFKGSWVHDESYPLYEAAQCPFIDDKLNCRKNGRPDSDYEKWRWNPYGCTMPRFNPMDLLERLRGKRLMFVGDSTSRNQWESMTCLLSTVIPNNKTSMNNGFPLKTFEALDYKASIEYFWAPFLVDLDSNKQGKRILHLDSMEKNGLYWKGVDILVFETSHWWTHSQKVWDMMQIGTGVYCFYALPDLLANSLLQPLRVYMRSQGITTPMMWCSFLAVVVHVPLSLLLVFVFGLGVQGVAIATWCTNFNMLFSLVAYVAYTGVCKNTWVGWSVDCLKQWWPLLHLALPSCFAVCLEWWWYEIMTLLAGYLPSPQVTVATAAIVIQTTSLLYSFPMALSSSVSTRVGNELGASRPVRARNATIVALGCAILVAIMSLTWTTILRNLWGRVFTHDQGVLSLTAAVLPIIGICELGNCPQTTGCGVLRGSARPAIGARINLGSFYLVGTPVALFMAFRLKQGFVGLIYGLVAAQVACALSILIVILRTDWAFEAIRAKQISGSDVDKFDEELGLLNETSSKMSIP